MKILNPSITARERECASVRVCVWSKCKWQLLAAAAAGADAAATRDECFIGDTGRTDQDE